MSGFWTVIENHSDQATYIAAYAKQLPFSPYPIKYSFSEMRLLQPGERTHVFGQCGQVVAWAIPSPSGGDTKADAQFVSSMQRLLTSSAWLSSGIMFLVQIATMGLSDFLPIELIEEFTEVGADTSVDAIVSKTVSYFIEQAIESAQERAQEAVAGRVIEEGVCYAATLAAKKAQLRQFKSKDGAARARQTVVLSWGLISSRVLRIKECDGEVTIECPSILKLKERRYFPMTRAAVGWVQDRLSGTSGDKDK